MGVFEVVLRKMPSSFLARKALCSQFLRLTIVAKSAHHQDSRWPWKLRLEACFPIPQMAWGQYELSGLSGKGALVTAVFPISLSPAPPLEFSSDIYGQTPHVSCHK